jgi:hypothetical protein
MPRLFRFQYFTKDDSPLLHQVRDLTILMEISQILYQKGYSYEDVFLNYPRLKEKDGVPFDFKIDDLMVMPTRPPLSDYRKIHRRVIYKTKHVLEEEMLNQMKTCFRTLSRQRITLHQNLAFSLPDKYSNRGLISFYVNSSNGNASAGYRQVSEYDIEKDWTDWSSISELPKSCAFLIFFTAGEKLPKMLYVFGIGGQEGLVFARILKNGLWQELGIDFNGPSRFIMVEFPIHNIPTFPTSLQFIKGIDYEVILDERLN